MRMIIRRYALLSIISAIACITVVFPLDVRGINQQYATESGSFLRGSTSFSLNRSVLNFGKVSGGVSGGSQTFYIQAPVGVGWSVNTGVGWLTVSPSSGSGNGSVTVSLSDGVNALSPGSYSGVISVTPASGSVQTIQVNVKVYGAGLSSAPVGEFSTPVEGSSVYNSVPVTGWVVDDVGVEWVKLYNGDWYVGDAVFIDGARPDVEGAYPSFPNHYKAGWGYMLLSHFLPGGGNGSYLLTVKAKDLEGHVIVLGTKRITVDNAHGVKPFGALESPAPGGVVSGKVFQVWGWALTPQPNSIAGDGSGIDVIVDGAVVGHPEYNLFRSDIASLFPGYANSNGAVGVYVLDSTKLSNGLHSISWNVRDSGGNTEGVGSRYFTVFNGSIIVSAFDIVLGSPERTSISASVWVDEGAEVYMKYGTNSGVYSGESSRVISTNGEYAVIELTGLEPDTCYYYRCYRETKTGSEEVSDEFSFHTARAEGSSFTFTVQADSHMDENSDLDQYKQTLWNILGDKPDFHIDLGDTFMCEKHSAPFTGVVKQPGDQKTVNERYVFDRGNFGLISHSVPLFLVNGNHEGELGWVNTGSAENIAIWTGLARLNYFLNPGPDDFYSGDSVKVPFLGLRHSWYAWNWGDALFIVLDPYWYTVTRIKDDAWVMTLGEVQYGWLKDTLAGSGAKYKFVFIHNLVGGLDGQMRGGMEAAPYFEWGGRGMDGSNSFSQKRPGWDMPIHDLMVKYGVNVVFHGHDHLYAKQVLDGVYYLEVPQPSAKNFTSGPNLAKEYHYSSGTILSSSGHIRVTVSASKVLVQYVRSWLSKDENASRKNGQVDDVWPVEPK